MGGIGTNFQGKKRCILMDGLFSNTAINHEDEDHIAKKKSMISLRQAMCWWSAAAVLVIAPQYLLVMLGSPGIGARCIDR